MDSIAPHTPLGRVTLARVRSPHLSLSQQKPRPTHLNNWGSSEDLATRAALRAFETKEASIRRRRFVCIGVIIAVVLFLILLASFMIPRAPSILITSRSASSASTREDALLGRFALLVKAEFSIDNGNFFDIAFRDVSVSLGTAGRTFARFTEPQTFTIPARSTRSFTLGAALNSAGDNRAITSMVDLLSCADLATRAASASSCPLKMTAEFTPVWLRLPLPQAASNFDIAFRAGVAA
jgi:hypothetical protein